jgi:hypothetical protein
LGVGPGRGTGLLFVVLGLLIVLIIGLAYLNPHIRRLENELPDAKLAEPGAPAAPVVDALGVTPQTTS